MSDETMNRVEEARSNRANLTRPDISSIRSLDETATVVNLLTESDIGRVRMLNPQTQLHAAQPAKSGKGKGLYT